MKLIAKSSFKSICSFLFLSICFLLSTPIHGQDTASQELSLRDQLKKFHSKNELKSFLKKKNANTQHLKRLEIDDEESSQENDFKKQPSDQLINIEMPKIRSTRTNRAATSDEALTQHNERLLTEGIPSSFDWSKQVQLSSVKSIGHCAASWVFAAAAFLEADSIINLNQSSILDLSEQYLISCDKISNGCDSGFLETPIDLAIQKGGVPFQLQYPYSPYSSQPRNICKTNNLFRTPDKYRMSYYDMYDQQKIKKIILKKPVSIAICGQDLLRYSPGQTQQSKILKCHPSHTLLNHAVLLVGYTQTYWIIKNEWSQKWGLNGYAYISRNQIEDCCIGQQLHTTGDKTTNCSVEGCQTCVQQYTCYKCQSGKYVYHDPFSGVQSCKPCQVQNCKQCFDYYQYCSYCIEGYAINQTSGKCQLSPIYGCNHMVNGYCAQCHKGFILSKDMTKCTADCSVKYCSKCEDGPCSSCLPGYSLISTNGIQKCQPNTCNVANCDLCDTNGTCIQCSQYMVMNGSTCINTCKIAKCLSCKNNSWLCDVCEDGKSFNYWTEACEVFNITNCGIHLFGQCFQCKPGYQIDGIRRTACLQICDVENCTSCVKTDTTVCLTCQPGYMLTNISIDTYCFPYTCSIPNCTACNQNGTSCLTCKTQFHIYNATSNACEIQCSKEDCDICLNNATYCQKCKAGYVTEYDSGTCYLADFAHCTLVGFDSGNFECWDCEPKYMVDTVTWKDCLLDCQDDNCEVCDLETLSMCQKCFDGYALYLDSGKLTCMVIPSLLPRCTLVSLNQTYCFKCDDYYYWNATILSCAPYTTGCKQLCMYCPVPGSTSEYCQCEPGFAYDLFTNYCGINPFDDNCLWIGQYGGSMICFQCAKGFVLSPNYKSCVAQCIAKNCTTCYQTSNVNCQVCDYGFYVNTTWQCSKCPVDNCKVCDKRVCFECKIGYQLVPDGSRCLSYVCQGDLVFNGFSCSCPTGTYFLNNTCVTCQQPECKWCDIDGCVQCLPGYFKSNGLCSPCISNCKQCTTQSDCKVCNQKFFYEDTAAKCISVGFNLTYIIQNGHAIQCLPGCVQCNSNGSCNICAPGYSLSPISKQCIPCQGKCRTCYFNIPEACLSCNTGFYFDELKCLPCNNKNCLQCSTDPNICTKCAIGFALQNKTCVNCSDNCLECNYKGQCIKCSPGFSINDLRVCEQCVGDCKRCDVYYLDRCINDCQNGQYIDDYGSCKACPQACTTCSNSNNCSKCKIGYILKNEMCIRPCQEGCYQCSSNDPLVCQQCFAGYALSTQFTCLADFSCNLAKTCIGCPLGSVLQNRLCINCTTGGNCTQCSAQSPDRCLLCINGFYLSNQTCSPCPQQCVLCQRQNLCTQCSQGFYMIRIESDESGRCLPCNPECKTCDIRPFQCLSCSNDSFELTISQTCISKDRIQIQVSIDITIDLFASIAAQVRSDLAACIGANYRNRTQLVLLRSLSNGSTLIKVQLATPEDQDVLTTLQNVKQSLSSANQLGGVNIISVSKINIYNPNTSNKTNQTSSSSTTQSQGQGKVLAIILGVTIPSAVIIILVIIGCILKKKRDQKSNAVINEDSFNEETISQKTKNDMKKNNKKLPPISTIKKVQVNDMFKETPYEKSHENLYKHLNDQSLGEVTNSFPVKPNKLQNSESGQISQFMNSQQINEISKIVKQEGQEQIDSQMKYDSTSRPINEKEQNNQEVRNSQNERKQLQSSEQSLSFNQKGAEVNQRKQVAQQNVLEVDDV